MSSRENQTISLPPQKTLKHRHPDLKSQNLNPTRKSRRRGLLHAALLLDVMFSAPGLMTQTLADVEHVCPTYFSVRTVCAICFGCRQTIERESEMVWLPTLLMSDNIRTRDFLFVCVCMCVLLYTTRVFSRALNAPARTLTQKPRGDFQVCACFVRLSLGACPCFPDIYWRHLSTPVILTKATADAAAA